MSDSAETLKAEIERLAAELQAWRARAEAAERLADRDALTGVLNRRGFDQALSAGMAYARRHGVPAALLYLDLDGFKTINDGLGHAAGDAALIGVARLLEANLRESDSVARLGGDEFAVLLLNADQAAARAKAEALARALGDEGFEWEGERRPLGGSFGVRAFTGQAAPQDWLAEADAAMWVRKRER
ncbi:GGDEF domain-containing protein [Brevundimonas sp. 2R-24]|uniref:diguanylate cyclase n=1 Tax=Peiella sedimenti TaxID=3061083 RepID=A0ABT8SNG3_9CAUL|nr:GGDEF domain-containing protein [Caulobacteraceae bacterium XZ-24]